MSTHALTAPVVSPSVTLEQDRRRRRRLVSHTVGYLLPEQGGNLDPAALDEPWEVRVTDISRLGVGFVSADAMKPGDVCRIRIGIGPMRLARRVRIRNCQSDAPNHFRIGAEFA
jgi:hypothetical protein